MLRDELLREMVEAFKDINNAKNLFDFQSYLKGENYLMSLLEQLGGTSTPGELARGLGVSRPRVAAMLCSLERKKLIKRSISKDDKRSIVVVITEKGCEWVELAGNEVHHALIDFIEKIGEEDTKEFIRIMKKLLLIDLSDKKDKSENKELLQLAAEDENKNIDTKEESNILVLDTDEQTGLDIASENEDGTTA